MTPQLRQHLRETILVVSALALGWWAHARPVLAASSSTALQYQFGAMGPQTTLSLYNPADQTITVYTGATEGNSNLSCTYQFHIQRTGDKVERRNCQPGSLLP